MIVNASKEDSQMKKTTKETTQKATAKRQVVRQEPRNKIMDYVYVVAMLLILNYAAVNHTEFFGAFGLMLVVVLDITIVTIAVRRLIHAVNGIRTDVKGVAKRRTR